MTLSPLRHFVVSAALWLPLSFFFWFLLSGPVIWPVARLADIVLPMLLTHTISQVEMIGAVIEVETRLQTAVGPEGQQGVLVFDVRPLIYAWCLPLFVGLVIATPLERRRRLIQLAIGVPVLWLIVTWGVVFDTMKLLAFDAGPLGAAAISSAGWSADAVALGYQFGYLILPAVAPVTLWVMLNQRFLEGLVGWSSTGSAGTTADAGGEPRVPIDGPTSAAKEIRPADTDTSSAADESRPSQ